MPGGSGDGRYVQETHMSGLIFQGIQTAGVVLIKPIKIGSCENIMLATISYDSNMLDFNEYLFFLLRCSVS
jgi:hypothetical protein